MQSWRGRRNEIDFGASVLFLGRRDWIHRSMGSCRVREHEHLIREHRVRKSKCRSHPPHASCIFFARHVQTEVASCALRISLHIYQIEKRLSHLQQAGVTMMMMMMTRRGKCSQSAVGQKTYIKSSHKVKPRSVPRFRDPDSRW